MNIFFNIHGARKLSGFEKKIIKIKNLVTCLCIGSNLLSQIAHADSKKYGPMIPRAEMAAQTITFGECRGISCLKRGLTAAQ